MTDLTEQWKKGELQNGWYWCKCYNEEIKLLYYDGDSFELDDPETKNYYFFLPKDIEKLTVLSPVPSYDEWFKIKNLASLTSLLQEKNIECLHRENKVKELLEECRHIIGIEKDFATCHFEEYTLVELLTKIDEVLK